MYATKCRNYESIKLLPVHYKFTDKHAASDEILKIGKSWLQL